MSDRIRKRTKYLTMSAMLVALSVVIMALGSLIEVLDLTTAVLASFLCIYAVIEMGGAYPWMIWLASSILSLLLLPLKTPAIFYALFFGFYPILKEKFERLRRPLSITLKTVSFHVSLAGIVLLLWLFIPSILEMDDMKWLPPILLYVGAYVGALVCFFVYDIALTRVITFYYVRLRNRFKIK